MGHIEGVEKLPEKYFAEFKTKGIYEIIEKYRTDNRISPVKERSE